MNILETIRTFLITSGTPLFARVGTDIYATKFPRAVTKPGILFTRSSTTPSNDDTMRKISIAVRCYDASELGASELFDLLYNRLVGDGTNTQDALLLAAGLESAEIELEPQDLFDEDAEDGGCPYIFGFFLIGYKQQ